MKNYKFFKGIYPTGVLVGETLSETNNNKGGVWQDVTLKYKTRRRTW